MKKAILFLFLFVLAVQANAQPNQEKAKAYYFSAQEQYNNGNYSKTLEYCNQVEELLGKTNARVEALRLKSHSDLGNTEKAKKSLDIFLTLNADESLLKLVSPYIIKIEEAERERAAWSFAQTTNSKESYEDYLQAYPNGKFSSDAKSEIKRIENELKAEQERIRKEKELKELISKTTFSEGLGAAKKFGKYGYIDESGNTVIPYQYDFVLSFKDGLAFVRKNDKHGYIDKEGNEVIKIEYSSLSSFDVNGFCWYIKTNTGSNKYKFPYATGVLNKKGEVIGALVTSLEADEMDREYVYYWTAHYLINDNDESENYRKAIILYSLISDDSKQYADAQLALGDIYTEEKGGIAKDNIRAFMFYNDAFTKGATLNPNQKERLGDAWYNGVGTPADKERALEIYSDDQYNYTYISSLNYKYVKTAIELKQYDKAETKIINIENNLSKRNKKNNDLYMLKGLLAESKGDLKAAKKWYRKAKK